MAEFKFKDDGAELTFGTMRFRLPLTETQADELMESAKALSEQAGDTSGLGELTELVIAAIDEILGPGASDAILAERDYTFFDALDVLRFIYGEFYRSWRERVIELGGRAALKI